MISIENQPLECPRVSVYITTKNRSELLQRAVNSVIVQSYKNIELIVVNDGSTDNTQQVISKLVDSTNIRLITNLQSKGPCIARNQAILISSGEFVTGLDDDDYFSNGDRILKFVDFWSIYCDENIACFDSVKVVTKSENFINNKKAVISMADLRCQNLIGNQVFAKRKTYIDAGLFDPKMPAWQDWDLWYRMAKNGVLFHNINTNSYTVDESHGGERITLGNNINIRTAMSRLEEKIDCITLREKSYLLTSIFAYPNIIPSFRELFILLLTLRIKSFMKYGLKKLRCVK